MEEFEGHGRLLWDGMAESWPHSRNAAVQLSGSSRTLMSLLSQQRQDRRDQEQGPSQVHSYCGLHWGERQLQGDQT